MITREERLRRYCKDFKEIENYEEAVQSTELYDLHHRKEIETLPDGTVVLRSKKQLIDMNLYYHRNAEELIFLKRSEHRRLHKHLEESREKMSAAHIGKKLSTETIAKISASKIGKCMGPDHPRWKGGISFDHASYLRMRKQKRLLLEDIVEISP